MRKNKKQRIILRIPGELKNHMQEDLRRTHEFAFERVGFLYTVSKRIDEFTTIIIAKDYEPVEDGDYLNDRSVGAKIGANAIRKGMQKILADRCGCFHVHMHDHRGMPSPSPTDKTGLPGVVESFSNVAKEQFNGYLILSQDNFFSSIRIPGKQKSVSADLITVVDFPMQFCYNDLKLRHNQIFDRQSFLGPESQALFENVIVGIVGYGGGGSHIGLQLSHVGVMHPTVFDDDVIEETNLNRLVGARWIDVLKKVRKTEIAKRVIRSVIRYAKPNVVCHRWQDVPELLQKCDLVVGCADTYAERQQLEAECRRYLIPYIDIGMDVYQTETGPPAISGQVMVSMPGNACFWCYGFLTEEKLGQEAAKYGKTGGRPQVVWPNGVLASTAVGIVTDLITGWTKRKDPKIYLEYDGNSGCIKDHIRLRFCDEHCSHYPLAQAGPVRYRSL